MKNTKLIQDFKYKSKQILFGLLGAILFSFIGIIIYYIAFYFNKNFISLIFSISIPITSYIGYMFFSHKFNGFEGFGADDFSFFDAFALFIVTFLIVYLVNTFDVTNMLYKEYHNEFGYFELFAKCFPRLVDLEWISARIVISEIFVMLFTLSNYFRDAIFFIRTQF